VRVTNPAVVAGNVTRVAFRGRGGAGVERGAARPACLSARHTFTHWGRLSASGCPDDHQRTIDPTGAPVAENRGAAVVEHGQTPAPIVPRGQPPPETDTMGVTFPAPTAGNVTRIASHRPKPPWA